MSEKWTGHRAAAGIGLLAWALAGAVAASAQAPTKPLNVLMIAVDDLRPQLGCYGDRLVRSPNIDRLAASGTVFRRAYCQQAVCSPSRTSLLTGKRPDTTRVYDLQTHFRSTIPDAVTLPQLFKSHGYHTQGFSKIYHGGLDDAASWSVPHWTPRKGSFGPQGRRVLAQLRERLRASGADAQRLGRLRGLPWEVADCDDGDLADGETAARAIEVLREVKDRPFFLGVGFLRPHLPFVAPKKYWDLYRREDLREAANPNPPTGAFPWSLSGFGELRAYVGMPKSGPVPSEDALSLIHGYLASVSYMDAQVGRLLDELERLGLRERTVVALWGDHGWELGEHGEWCKHETMETSTHAPLIVAAPGKKRGSASNALVEFVDLYPTLAELCGLTLPPGLEGLSFAPLLSEPDRPWKSAAFSQYPRSMRQNGRGMGYSMRTDRYRLTEWRALTSDFRAYELYDHSTDPGENANLAGDPARAELLASLRKQLHAGWQGATPKPR